MSGSVAVDCAARDVSATELTAAHVHASTDAGDLEPGFTTAPSSIDLRTDAGEGAPGPRALLGA
jgi:hypothetical protein